LWHEAFSLGEVGIDERPSPETGSGKAVADVARTDKGTGADDSTELYALKLSFFTGVGVCVIDDTGEDIFSEIFIEIFIGEDIFIGEEAGTRVDPRIGVIVSANVGTGVGVSVLVAAISREDKGNDDSTEADEPKSSFFSGAGVCVIDGTGKDIFIEMFIGEKIFIGEEAVTRADPSIGVDVSGNIVTTTGAGIDADIGAGGRILSIGKVGNDDRTSPETGSGTATDMGFGAGGMILSIGNCGADGIT